MKRPEPDEVDVKGAFFNVCEGMRHGAECETTVMVYCRAAQEYGRWELTRDELDTFDSGGEFYFNGTIKAGLFIETKDKYNVKSDTFRDYYEPTGDFFARLLKVGRIKLTQ